jgi:hypothetical protein
LTQFALHQELYHVALHHIAWPFSGSSLARFRALRSRNPRFRSGGCAPLTRAEELEPAKVVTDETLEVKKGDVQSAAAEQLRMPGTPEAQAQPAPANAPSSTAQNEKKAPENEKLAKELAALKEQIKQAESDLDLAKREQALQQDSYFSNPDYVHDTAGKAKLDAIKQQITDKQMELDRLKARLAVFLKVHRQPLLREAMRSSLPRGHTMR